MSSISKEIKELFELHQSGALTLEEFTLAKQAIITAHTNAGIDTPVLAQPQRAAPNNRDEDAKIPLQADDKIKDEIGDLKNRNTKQRIALNIRREKVREGIENKGEIQFLVDCFTSDFAGDFLYGASKSLEVMEKILLNIRNFPDNENYKRLKLANNQVKKHVVQQRGALEFFIAQGAQLVGEGEAGYFMIDLAEMNVEAALECFEKVKYQFFEVKVFREEERRKKAENVTKAAVQRETRRLERMKEVEGTREETVPKRTKGEGQETGTKPNRVPMDKALEYLTGSRRL